MAAHQEDHHVPPPGAPPLLNRAQVIELCSNGWINIDLPQQLERDIDVLQTIAAEFFAKQEHMKLEYTSPKHPEDEGYYHVPDEKEYFTFHRELTQTFAIQDHVRVIWPQVAAFLHRMLCDLSSAGGLDPTTWDEVIKGALTFPDEKTSLRDSPTLLRLFRYDPATGTAENHTDLGLLTLCVGTGAGLEVQDLSQRPAKWTGSAKCTVMVGESLRRLSSNNIRAGLHRVVANPVGRQSFVFALRPNLSTSVDLEHFGGSGMVDLRDLFTSIKGSKYNVNARTEVRQQQRQQHVVNRADVGKMSIQ
ncbi:hypothetical protein AMS68_005811 [Peltaster fructicola]|uniref:Fe2OG dioxygenase domain-containing protein n=1 Tax=Peltaster fructicola TaxID=286661 RepID=A0A6H0XZX3_9PEZI|nr:hypothetical protein AMS68_005811 [Peltaster fructicola]